MDEKKLCIVMVYHYEVNKKGLVCEECPFYSKCNVLERRNEGEGTDREGS